MTGLHEQRALNNPNNCDPARYSPSSSSQSLVIVSNIKAALEYEERSRQGTWGSGYSSAASLPGSIAGGLPPPPRPRSRARAATRSSPVSPPEQFTMSVPNSPLSSTQQLAEHEYSTSNPYINPVPRLSYFLRDEPPLLIPGGGQSSPDGVSLGHASSIHSHADTSAQPGGEARPSPVQTPSESPTPSKLEGLRHHRALSSLQRVEKMLGKSRNALGMLTDPGLRSGRRSSDADLQQGAASEKPIKDPLMRQYRRVLERGKAEQASSAPSSPISTARLGPLGSSTRIGVSKSRPPPAVASSTTLPHPVVSHDRQDSDMSITSLHSLSPSSDNSHEPSTTVAERHISISSTLYTSRQHSFDHPPSPVTRSTNMNDDRHESFIDLASPTLSPQFHDFGHTIPTVSSVLPDSRVSPRSYSSEESNNYQVSSRRPLLPRLTTNTKPPLPTAPKPKFRRSRSAQPPLDRTSEPSSKESSPLDGFTADMERGLRHIPSTTNFLDPHVRAERIRKTRKLTQLFGQMPGVAPEPIDTDLANGCLPVAGGLSVAPRFTKRRHKQAASMLHDPVVPVYDAKKRVVWPPPEDAQHLYLGERRRSLPFTPQDFSSIGGLSYTEDGHSILTISREVSHVIEIGSQEGVPQSDWDSHIGHGHEEPLPSGSPTSFIDLSDEEGPHDGFSAIPSAETPKFERTSRQPFSPSTPSLYDSLSPEQQAEEERRRKREKLAKLHRFLGSRVPTHLVLGPLEEGVPLPPAAPSTPLDTMYEEDEDARKIRIRRRRSSSAAEFTGTWSDDIDRLKEDLNEREKAINVRRAVKMEKLFGVAPPQMLYHTRQAMSSPGSSIAPAGAKTWQPTRPLSYSPKSPSPSSSPAGFRNLNQSAYKGKSKRGGRPGTAESAQPLLDHGADDWDQSLPLPMSDVYLHYRHSLNSLNHIIDRDDRQSLAELHDYLSGNQDDGAEQTPPDEFVVSSGASTKAERRRSLPSRTSMTSVSSDWSLLPSPPEDSTFQTRRRRAAKLTQFFGVNYRDLMSEILDSIEKGLEEERGKGTLKPDEVQDLLQKLIKLKTKRNNLS